MRACSLLRHGQNYRADQFALGLNRLGYTVETKWQRNPKPSDLLLIWNRNRANEAMADIYERAGARVIIAENGYLDRVNGQKHYALALSAHNGAGRWFVGDSPRFEVQEEPWRSAGEKVLVLPQRGIGQRGVAMPSHWVDWVLDRLERATGRPIVVRPHPGHGRNAIPLDFRNVWCAVTWGSGAGIKALREGVPVFHCLDKWIGSAAAAPLVDDIETRHTPDRRLLWTRVTWAQWSLDEIGTGEAFDRLLNEEDRCLFRTGQPSINDGRQGHGGRDWAPGPPSLSALGAHP